MFDKIREILLFKGTKTTAEGILGTQARVDAVAEVWHNLEDEMMLISAGLVHDFTLNNDFTANDLANYKRGVNGFALMIRKCAEERAERLKKSGVGKKSTASYNNVV